jgi:hypothetical protein
MKILSKAVHADTALELEKILLKAIDGCNMKVISFCQSSIYPLYKSSIKNSGGMHKSTNEDKFKKIFGI